MPPPQPPQERRVRPAAAAASAPKSTNPFLQCAGATPKKATKKEISLPVPTQEDIPLQELPSQQSAQRSQFEASMAALNRVGLPGVESLQRTYSLRESSPQNSSEPAEAAAAASNTRANLQALIEHDLSELNKAAARAGLNEVWPTNQD